MKISPVAGTPTIQNPPSTGLAPEKLQRIKMMVSGQQPAETPTETEAKEIIPQVQPPSNKIIKMKTNANPEQLDAAQETVPEAQTEPEKAISDTGVQTKPVPEAIQQVSPEVAAIAKEKRAAQVMRMQYAEKEKALEEKLAKAEALESRIQGGEGLSVLLERGVTFDQLKEQILAQNQFNPKQLKSDVEKMVEERLAKKDAEQAEAVLESMTKNVNQMVFGSDAYPFIKAGRAHGQVMDLVNRAWYGDPKAPDLFPGGYVFTEDEACQAIEDQLKEEAKAYAKLLKPEPTTPAVEPQPKTTQKIDIKTLTNKDSARPRSGRRQRALAAFLGQK